MTQTKEVIRAVRVSVPITGEEMVLIKRAKQKVKQDTGVALGYKKLLLYLVVKELTR